MEAKKLTELLSVAAQISATDVAAIKAAGFRSIVCHRPDGEGGGDQPLFQSVADAARDAGLSARYQPVVSGKATAADAAAFAVLLEELPQPVLAYCRTGTRSTALWTAAAALMAGGGRG